MRLVNRGKLRSFSGIGGAACAASTCKMRLSEMEIEADEGRRIRLELFGENYYLSVFREGGGWAFMPTVPRENDPLMSRERLAVETICRVLGEATRNGND